MAKRFIDTNFYRSPFVRALKPHLKSFYSFIICDCSHAGIWICDFEAVKLYIGYDVTQKEFEKEFIEKEKAFKLKDGVYFFPDFIEHQYPTGLHENNKAHKGIIHELKKSEIDTETLKPLQSPFKGSKDKDKEMDKEGGTGETNPPDMDYYRELWKQLKEDTRNLEQARMMHRIDQKQIEYQMEQFFRRMIAEERTWENYGDMRKNFLNWLGKRGDRVRERVPPKAEVNADGFTLEQMTAFKLAADDFYNSRMSDADRAGVPLTKQKQTEAYAIDGEDPDNDED